MDIIEQFLHSIAYKFPKGYPDMDNSNDVLLLENELKNLGLALNELNVTEHWSERVKERGNILDIENLPKDYPLTKEDVIQLIENELTNRANRLENLKDFPLSLTHQIGYKLLQPIINHNNKNIPLNLKVKYSTKNGDKISVGNSYLAIINDNTLITFILLSNDDSLSIEKAMADHIERKKKEFKKVKILNPTNYQFIIPASKPSETGSIASDELPYKIRTDYRVGANFEHEKYGTGKIVATSNGSGGKGDSRGHLDWIDVDFGKPYLSGGILKTIRKIPNIYTSVSTLVSKANTNDINPLEEINKPINLKYYHQLVDQTSYSPQSKKYYKDFLNNLEKQSYPLTQRQKDVLEKIKAGK